MKIIIGVDIDGVLRNWSKSFNRVYLDFYPQHKDLLEPINTWNFYDSYKFERTTKKDFLKDNSKDILLNAPSFIGTKEKLDWLVEQSFSKDFIVKIITQQSSKANALYTFNWLKKHSFFHENFISVASNKDKWRYSNAMIDDSEEVLSLCSLNNTSIKVLKPYNKDCNTDFTVSEFVDLDENLLEAILEKTRKKLSIIL